MGLTVVPGTMIEDGSITDPNFTNTTITSTDMALDPRNASNISSGSVPLAQLGNVPAADLTGLDDDIALLGFKTAANGSLAKYNLLDQTVDAFEDASGVDASASTDEIRDSAKYYSGTAAASGGTITTHGAYTVHSFITAGNENFVVGAAGNVAALVIAGGGGAGTFSGGGGGAGGFRTSASHAVTAQTYVVTVGAGGAGGTSGTPAGYVVGVNGGNSVFDTITSAGGGGGMGYTPQGPAAGGVAGGSGGGSGTTGQGYSAGTGGAGNTPSTSPSQGYAGGLGRARDWPGAPNVNHYGGGGGGGGASGVGTDSCNTPGHPNCGYGGNGGPGTANDYRTGSNVTYAGGGGAAGGRYYPPSPVSFWPNGTAGAGGGGTAQTWDAAYDGIYNPAAAGTANTGGGGGGGAGGNWGGYGGSGIVVIRYPTGDLSTYNNMTLVSNLTAANSAPTKGDIVFTYTNGAGTAVINTNITAEVSADDGSTWTTFSGLTSQGTTGGHTIVTAHDQTISSTITSPWNMRYRIKTLVQSASMQTRIQAVSLGWS